MSMMIRSYRELARLKTFDERFEYLKLSGRVGQATFGYHRYLNQLLYTCNEWLEVRDKVIVRDDGRDLGIDIIGRGLLVHHINPLTIEDIENNSPMVFDLDNLITTSDKTHRAIHYGDSRFLQDRNLIVRRPNDTSPWR